jgi:hypothetical protein
VGDVVAEGVLLPAERRRRGHGEAVARAARGYGSQGGGGACGQGSREGYVNNFDAGSADARACLGVRDVGLARRCLRERTAGAQESQPGTVLAESARVALEATQWGRSRWGATPRQSRQSPAAQQQGVAAPGTGSIGPSPSAAQHICRWLVRSSARKIPRTMATCRAAPRRSVPTIGVCWRLRWGGAQQHVQCDRIHCSFKELPVDGDGLHASVAFRR